MALTKIRYHGLSDERIMTKKELGDAGFPVDGTLKWERSNRWVQFMADPSDEFLEMLKHDGNFTVTDAEGDEAEGKPIVAHDPTKADDTGSTVIDNNQAKDVENKPPAGKASKGK
jgi:hypothetical protein